MRESKRRMHQFSYITNKLRKTETSNEKNMNKKFYIVEVRKNRKQLLLEKHHLKKYEKILKQSTLEEENVTESKYEDIRFS